MADIPTPQQQSATEDAATNSSEGGAAPTTAAAVVASAAEEPTDDGAPLTLLSNDDQAFSVSRKAAMLSNTVKTMLEDCDGEMDENGLPLPAVDGATLDLIVKWIEHHKDDPTPVPRPRVLEDSDDSDSDDEEEEPEVVIPEWDQEFLPTKDEEKNELFKLLNAANYLHIKGLLDMGCKHIADKISAPDKEIEWVRDYLNMENDYTPEEEARIREETAWARATPGN